MFFNFLPELIGRRVGILGAIDLDLLGIIYQNSKTENIVGTIMKLWLY
jgi:hypothetical protein